MAASTPITWGLLATLGAVIIAAIYAMVWLSGQFEKLRVGFARDMGTLRQDIQVSMSEQRRDADKRLDAMDERIEAVSRELSKHMVDSARNFFTDRSMQTFIAELRGARSEDAARMMRIEALLQHSGRRD